MSEKFDYYYGEESESCSFYRIPRLLIVGERFSGLSTDAKLLYGQAGLMAGLPLEDPAEYARLVSELMV